MRELWIKLSQVSPDVHFSTKVHLVCACVPNRNSPPLHLPTTQADLVSVFEHLKSGQVGQAQLSAAKYCHVHPGDPAEAVLLAVLQM